MFDFAPIQIILVLVVALLVFGPKRLPEMGRNLGRGFREFRHSISGTGGEPTPASVSAATADAEGEIVGLPEPDPVPVPVVAIAAEPVPVLAGDRPAA